MLASAGAPENTNGSLSRAVLFNLQSSFYNLQCLVPEPRKTTAGQGGMPRHNGGTSGREISEALSLNLPILGRCCCCATRSQASGWPLDPESGDDDPLRMIRLSSTFHLSSSISHPHLPSPRLHLATLGVARGELPSFNSLPRVTPALPDFGILLIIHHPHPKIHEDSRSLDGMDIAPAKSPDFAQFHPLTLFFTVRPHDTQTGSSRLPLPGTAWKN